MKKSELKQKPESKKLFADKDTLPKPKKYAFENGVLIPMESNIRKHNEIKVPDIIKMLGNQDKSSGSETDHNSIWYQQYKAFQAIKRPICEEEVICNQTPARGKPSLRGYQHHKVGRM